MSRRRVAVAAVAGAYAALAVLDRRRVRADRARTGWLDRSVLAEGRAREVRSADGTALHVTTYGPEGAPTVVLVHGWMCRSDYWTPQVAGLSRDLRLVTYDLRGHGRSRVERGCRLTSDDLADDLEAVLEGTLEPGSRAVLVGHSMGAMSVVAWAGRHTAQVPRRAAAVLLASSGVSELSAALSVFGPIDRSRVARRALGNVVFRSPFPYLGRTPISLRSVHHMSLSRHATPAQVAFIEDMVVACPPRVRAGWGTMMDRLDLRDALGALDVPAVVVVGTDDRMTPPSLAHALAGALPRLEALHELPGVGHMSTVEAPEFFNDEIRRLVDAHVGPGARP